MNVSASRLAAGVVRGYQVLLRPFLPRACRFEPSCSEYSRQALLARGLIVGTWLSMRRVARCHPWHPGGYDPPPLPREPNAERPGG